MLSQSKPLPGTPLDWAHPLNRGLVACWTMADGAGTRVSDVSANGNHGRFTNMTQGSTSGWTGGPYGSALRFDGSDDFITVPESGSLDITSEITFGGSVYPTGSADYQMIVGKVTAAGRQYAVFLTSGDTSSIFVELNGLTFGGKTISKPWVIEAWNDVRVTYLSGPGVVIYLNGVSVFTQALTGSMTHTASDVYIGAHGNDNTFHVTGRVDNVRIHNRALPPHEIWQLYSQPYCMFAPSRVLARFVPPTVTFKPAWAVGASQVYSGFGT